MDSKKYYGLLLKCRNDGIRFRLFMGRRWFIAKGLVLVVALALVWMDDPIVRGLALFALGFASGTIAGDVRSYFIARKFWPYQKGVLNWDKIETLLKEAL